MVDSLQIKAMTDEEIRQAQEELEQQQMEAQEELAAMLALILLVAIQRGHNASTSALLIPGLTFPQEAAERFVEAYKDRLAAQLMDTTRKDIEEILRIAQEEGWALTRFRDEVRAVLNQAARERAEIIGLSEAVRMTNFGALLAYQQAGFPYKRWVAVLDAKTCPFCKAMDGQIIPLNQPFARVGDVIKGTDEKGKAVEMTVSFIDPVTPPLHPRCRCVLVPANTPTS